MVEHPNSSLSMTEMPYMYYHALLPFSKTC